MEKFKILYANKSYYMTNFENALYVAKKESLNGYRVSIFNNNDKLITFQNGEIFDMNYQKFINKCLTTC